MVYSVYTDAACGHDEHTPPLLTMHGPGQEAGLNQCEPSGSQGAGSSPAYVFGKCVNHQIYLQAHDLPDCSDDGGEVIYFSQVGFLRPHPSPADHRPCVQTRAQYHVPNGLQT